MMGSQTKLAPKAKLVIAVMAGSLVLGGCATTGSVKRAQARADEAFAASQDGLTAAQRAQTAADGAMGAAGRAQTTADGAAQSALAANASATGASADARTAGAQMAAMSARLKKLEAQVRKLKGKKHGKPAHKPKYIKGHEAQPARFH